MSSIGPDFGVTKEMRGQQTPTTPRTNTTLQTLGPATGEEVLSAHDAVSGQVLTPPRLEQSWMSIYIKMNGVEDSFFHPSKYKIGLTTLFFADDEASPEQLDFANAFMAEAAGYGIDGHVFCSTACETKRWTDTFRRFVSQCMTKQFGPPKQLFHDVHRNKVRENVETILAKAEAEKEHEIKYRRNRTIELGLAKLFGLSRWEEETAADAKSLASARLMVEVAIHHLSQLRTTEDLADLALGAKLMTCLGSLKIAKEAVAEHLEVDDIIQKLEKHAEGAIDDSVFDKCAEVATLLLPVSPEQAQALLAHIAEMQAMTKLNAVMEWIKKTGLTTIGGVGKDNRGDFAFGPYPPKNRSFDIERHGAKAFELAEAWALNPYADMARVTAILDYLQRKFPEHLDPSHPLLLAYEELKATLAASPVPAVKDRAKLL
jgi:hypothetical protein